MLIVKTLDNKMLQDTVSGVIIQPFRPTLVENTSFIEQRTQKGEHRPKEVEILYPNFEPNEGVTDLTLESDWNEYRASLGPKEKTDYDKFLAGWVKANGTKGKETKPVDDPEKIKNGKLVEDAKDGKKA